MFTERDRVSQLSNNERINDNTISLCVIRSDGIGLKLVKHVPVMHLHFTQSCTESFLDCLEIMVWREDRDQQVETDVSMSRIRELAVIHSAAENPADTLHVGRIVHGNIDQDQLPDAVDTEGLGKEPGICNGEGIQVTLCIVRMIEFRQLSL